MTYAKNLSANSRRQIYYYSIDKKMQLSVKKKDIKTFGRQKLNEISIGLVRALLIRIPLYLDLA